MDRVGENIRKIRISKGLTQADLADALDVTTAAISRYELGQRELRFEQVELIANLLEVSVFDLYNYQDKLEVQEKRLKEIQARTEEAIQEWSSENPDEETQEKIKTAQLFIEDVKKQLQDVTRHITLAHDAQIMSKGSLQFDKAKRQQNKRTENLVSMFSKYPVEVQNRILTIVSAFGELNSVGQKRAVERINELAELPRYQAQ